ncbi:ABC transporter permease [Sinorhizobium mexicanum]|uniref:ABC transporter permease n=1 Tax=Sinorhizobium mexicanum TaxID=375549 RepID=A0A859R5Y5_9HYPH|nr:ABC transporter permease [Sinorhizobium mexicanum]QLL66281.1 ABC transporter permease [Sinorhizobium mexicanum]
MELIRQHARVTAALMIREMSTRYGGKPGGYLWALFDPVAHVVMLTLIFQTIARLPALGTSFPLFFATGYLPFHCYQTMQSFVSGTIKSNKALLSYPMVTPADAVSSRYLLQASTSFLIVIIVMNVVALESDLTLHIDLASAAGACFLATLLGLGVGLSNIALFARFPIYEQIFGVVMRPLMLLSGVLFLPHLIPHPFDDVLLFNPVVHAIILFRKGVYPEYWAQGLDLNYLYTFTAISVFVGLSLFTFSARAMREG